MTSAIAAGYRKGIATIIDANVITLITAFILFVLATAGVKGFAFILGVGTIVSLFTAVVFTQAVLGGLRPRPLHALARPARRLPASSGSAGTSTSPAPARCFFSISGVILAIGALAFATKQLNLGIDFESGTRVKAASSRRRPSRTSARRSPTPACGTQTARRSRRWRTPSSATNVFQIEGELAPEEAAQIRPALESAFGIEAAGDAFQETSDRPDLRRSRWRDSAVLAIIFSLLLISAYMASASRPSTRCR